MDRLVKQLQVVGLSRFFSPFFLFFFCFSPPAGSLCFLRSFSAPAWSLQRVGEAKKGLSFWKSCFYQKKKKKKEKKEKKGEKMKRAHA
jgi:hypothetical protein